MSPVKYVIRTQLALKYCAEATSSSSVNSLLPFATPADLAWYSCPLPPPPPAAAAAAAGEEEDC